MPGLTPEQVQKIHKLLHDKKLLQAKLHEFYALSEAAAQQAEARPARARRKPKGGKK